MCQSFWKRSKEEKRSCLALGIEVSLQPTSDEHLLIFAGLAFTSVYKTTYVSSNQSRSAAILISSTVILGPMLCERLQTKSLLSYVSPDASNLHALTWMDRSQTGSEPMLETALKLRDMALKDEYFIKRKLAPNVGECIWVLSIFQSTNLWQTSLLALSIGKWAFLQICKQPEIFRNR